MRRLLAVAVACACALPAATAFAHEGNPNFRSDVRAVTPATDGITIEVLNRDDRLLLTNRSGQDVLIEGYQREPYARVLADGTVQVNRNSEATYLNEERFGQVAIPDSVSPDAAPDWQTLSRTGRFEWHDHRFHWMAEGTPPIVKDESKLTKVNDWEIPIRIGDRAGAITGTLWWTPQDDGSVPVAAIVALVAVLLAAAAFVVIVRRRRRRPAAAASRTEAW
ncbi:MAG TPA: hypothetical protein VNZ62_05720 [Capillimicrobium sp.]|nr:hypothetical protein [Capillimicrobium sp.]